MNLSAYIFHGVMVAAAASATVASSIGWGLEDPQRTQKSVREDSQRNQHGRGIHGGGIRYGK